MKYIDSLLRRLNRFQQNHAVAGFAYAVIKKYADNTGGYHAALLTYYGFLSLFPLLLILLTILHVWFHNNPELQAAVSDNISGYFPLLGNQLQSHISSLKGVGLSLVVGILFTLYGARGGADALRFALDNIWYIPKSRRAGFPKNLLKSLTVIGISALGFLATLGASIAASGLGESIWAKVMLGICGAIILSLSLAYVFRFALSQALPLKKLLVGAIVAGVVIQLLLTFGGMFIASQLKHLDSLYGTFAIVLGLLFWIYLLAQVIVYAAEIDAVREHRLWPRSLDINMPTDADKRAYQLRAQTEHYIRQQKVRVGYGKNQEPGTKDGDQRAHSS